jgi:serine/threonine protein kinase
MRGILSGYESLNRRNIYHRDLRPSRIYYSKYKKEYLIGNLEEARIVMAVDMQQSAMLTPRGVPFFNSENVNEILRRNDRLGHYNVLQNDYIFLKKLILYLGNTSYEDTHDVISNTILKGVYDSLHTLQPL